MNQNEPLGRLLDYIAGGLARSYAESLRKSLDDLSVPKTMVIAVGSVTAKLIELTNAAEAGAFHELHVGRVRSITSLQHS